MFMTKEKNQTPKTILHVGYCESNSEWLDRVINELADENRNFVDFQVLCY